MKVISAGQLVFNGFTGEIRPLQWHFDMEGEMLNDEKLISCICDYLKMHGRLNLNDPSDAALNERKEDK